jgi:GH15 family glucan-1,4-alpha-glucosidase
MVRYLSCLRFAARQKFRNWSLGKYNLPLFALNVNLLSHLAGYRESRPVRIGNGAAFHQQFDIYGELMDGIYLYNKYGKPVTWDQWVSVREILGIFSIYNVY